MVYGLSLLLNAWGFLAVFFAAVALRQTELKLTGSKPEARQRLHTEVEDGLEHGTPFIRVSESSLIFKEHIERIAELVLILLIGGMLFVNSWSLRAVVLAVFVFTVARPLSVFVGLLGTRAPLRLKSLAAWFGVRGIGSLYYLMFAIQHGLPEELALELIHFTLVVVVLSIMVHGVSVKPMMTRLWRKPMLERTAIERHDG